VFLYLFLFHVSLQKTMSESREMRLKSLRSFNLREAGSESFLPVFTPLGLSSHVVQMHILLTRL
jgi:hypothetical protein